MILLDKVNKFKECKQFKEYKSENEDSYLVHLFLLQEKEEIGYYSPSKDLITTFSLITFNKIQEDEIFKDEHSKVQPLELNKLTLSPEDAVKKLKDIQKEKYSAEVITQNIFLLQNIGGTMVYNDTLVTQSLKMINIRINAESGDIIREDVSSLMQLGKQIKGERDGSQN